MKLGTRVHYEQSGEGVVIGFTYVANTVDIRNETGDVIPNVPVDDMHLKVLDDEETTD